MSHIETLLHWPVFLIWACIVIVYINLDRWRRNRRFEKRNGCEPAVSNASVRDPFIGLDFIHERLISGQSGRRLADCLEKFKQFGTTYSVKRLTFQVVQTCDPENLKFLLATGFNDFRLPASRVSAMREFLGNGIFTLDGEEWQHARSVVKLSVDKEKMAQFPDILERHFQSMLVHLSDRATEVDLQPLFFQLTMDIATELLMGHSTHMLDKRLRRAKDDQFVDDVMLCSEEAIRKMSYGPLRFFRFNLAATRAKTRVFGYMDDYIDELLKIPKTDNNGQKNAFQEFMTSLTDHKSIRDQLLHFLLASRDTTASLLSNLFFVLAKNPELYAKLRSEVLSKVGHGIPTFKELKDMEYLRWCVNESLRLHPVIPSNGREATTDTVLPRGGGADGKSPLFIRQGSVVLYNTFAMHRQSSIFGSRTEEFVPERWDGLRPGWGFLPFSGGPRVCVGQQVALLESYYIIARMTQEFERIESQDAREWMELTALAMTCRNGNRIKLWL